MTDGVEDILGGGGTTAQKAPQKHKDNYSGKYFSFKYEKNCLMPPPYYKGAVSFDKKLLAELSHTYQVEHKIELVEVRTMRIADTGTEDDFDITERVTPDPTGSILGGQIVYKFNGAQYTSGWLLRKEQFKNWDMIDKEGFDCFGSLLLKDKRMRGWMAIKHREH
ncbi:MAG: hypothetical protein FWF97_00330 [Alphaproteobacteria bacterium]|nr:hypothetical protein [Alphaproteobacteria bacterium]